MKGERLFSTAMFLFMAFLLNAKVNVGVEVMPQLSTKLSWSAGVNVEIPLNAKLYLSPGVFYSQRHKYGESLWEFYDYLPEGAALTSYEKASVSVFADYISIPIMFGVKKTVNADNAIKIAGGIYYACLLGGKSKLRMDDNGDVSEYKLRSYGNVIDGRSDFGLCVDASYLFHKHYQIGINLQHGLRKIYQSYEMPGIKDEFVTHRLTPGVRFHQSLGLSLAYVF